MRSITIIAAVAVSVTLLTTGIAYSNPTLIADIEDTLKDHTKDIKKLKKQVQELEDQNKIQKKQINKLQNFRSDAKDTLYGENRTNKDVTDIVGHMMDMKASADTMDYVRELPIDYTHWSDYIEFIEDDPRNKEIIEAYHTVDRLNYQHAINWLFAWVDAKSLEQFVYPANITGVYRPTQEERERLSDVLYNEPKTRGSADVTLWKNGQLSRTVMNYAVYPPYLGGTITPEYLNTRMGKGMDNSTHMDLYVNAELHKHRYLYDGGTVTFWNYLGSYTGDTIYNPSLINMVDSNGNVIESTKPSVSAGSGENTVYDLSAGKYSWSYTNYPQHNGTITVYEYPMWRP